MGEVGHTVSSTLDLETVLTTIVSRAVQLSGLDGGVVFEYDEGAEEFVQRAMTETGEALAEARRTDADPPGRRRARAYRRSRWNPCKCPISPCRAPTRAGSRVLIDAGIRAVLAVPLLREDRLIGWLGVARKPPR